MLPITLLIPAFQPSPSLQALITTISPHLHSLVVVNDGSSNQHDTLFKQIRAQHNVHYIHHENNQGKGAALKSGMQYWRNKLARDSIGIITADADGQHTVNDILKLSKALSENRETIHLGVRIFSKSTPLRSHLGNVITRSVFRLITGFKLKDTQTGLRGLPATFIPHALGLQGNHYEYETNILTYSIKHQWAIQQHHIETIYLENNASSHFKPLIDSIRIYSSLIKSLYY